MKAHGVRILEQRDLRRIAEIAARTPLDGVTDAHTSEQRLPGGRGRICLIVHIGVDGDCLDGHFIARERSRLVRTDDGTAPERLRRPQPAHDGARGRHALYAERKDDGDDRAHALRDGGDRHGDGAHQALQKGVPAQKQPRKEGEGDKQHCGGDDPAEFCDGRIERRGRGPSVL